MSLLNSKILLIFVICVTLTVAGIIKVDETENPKKNVYSAPKQKNDKFDHEMGFDDYKKSFGKGYKADSGQDTVRKAAFEKNMQKMKNTGCSPCGVNSMMDKTDEEIASLMGTLPGRGDETKNAKKNRLLQQVSVSTMAKPASFDWRTFGVITSVKNQKACGSCWAFAATSLLESQLIRRQQATNSIDLAEQYLLQCDNASFRCQGGYVNTAISIGLSNGLPLESAYPYNYASNYTDVCTPNVANYKPNVTTNFVGYFSRTIRKDDNGLIAMLLQRPVVLAIAANEVVYYRPTSTERTMRCSSAQSSTPDYLNHAVQLVGYTETEWIIKNSWSTGWGVNGYVYISRAPAENCGIGFYIYSMDAKLPDPAI